MRLTGTMMIAQSRAGAGSRRNRSIRGALGCEAGPQEGVSPGEDRCEARGGGGRPDSSGGLRAGAGHGCAVPVKAEQREDLDGRGGDGCTCNGSSQGSQSLAVLAGEEGAVEQWPTCLRG